MKSKLVSATALALCIFASATIQAQSTPIPPPSGAASLFQITEISGSVQAVNYEHRSGSTKVDFIGTSLMPSADGHAKVDSKRGTMEIGAEFAGLAAPGSYH